MKIELKKIDSTQREMQVYLEGEKVKEKFEEVFKQIGKEAKVAGFRPGHVPRPILEKHYAKEADEQVLRELLPQVYKEAVEKEKLEVLNYPYIEEVKLNRDSLFFKAKLEVMPEVPLKNYRGIKVHHRTISVTDEEVEKYLSALAKKRKIEQMDDKFARGLGYFNLEELKDSLQKQIFLEKQNQNRQEKEKEIFDYLLKEADFKVPVSLKERKLQEILRQAKLELSLKGLAKEAIEEKEKELIQQLQPEAEIQARLQVILMQIAKKENIALDQEEGFGRVIEFLLQEADWSK